jgi:hypothetical protein
MFKEVVEEKGETMLLQADGTRGKDGTNNWVSSTNLSQRQECNGGRSTGYRAGEDDISAPPG